MNADWLLGHYERIADAPDAIARLRRFILELAVRGKLVEQNPVDEPASELLKRIAAEKARLVKAGKIKKSKSKQADRFNTLFELPKSWKWATLCDLFLYDAGVKRQPKNLNQKLWLLELEDIEKDSGRLRVRITASERESKSTKSEFSCWRYSLRKTEALSKQGTGRRSPWIFDNRNRSPSSIAPPLSPVLRSGFAASRLRRLCHTTWSGYEDAAIEDRRCRSRAIPTPAPRRATPYRRQGR